MPDTTAIDWPATVERVIVTGSRSWPEDDRVLPEVLAHLWLRYPLALLVVGYDPLTGQPKGVDRRVFTLWTALGGEAECHPAEWDRHGKGAGMIRNGEIVAKGADLCLAFIHNESRGATHCVGLAERAKIPVWRYTQPRVHDA